MFLVPIQLPLDSTRAYAHTQRHTAQHSTAQHIAKQTPAILLDINAAKKPQGTGLLDAWVLG